MGIIENKTMAIYGDTITTSNATARFAMHDVAKRAQGFDCYGAPLAANAP